MAIPTAADVENTARQLVRPGKGILAADESTSTIRKRMEEEGIEGTEQNRQAYREMLFTAPNLGDFISGVILFDETIRQRSADGTPFVELLKRRNMIPGVKVDKGAKSLAGFPGERITEGLDGLRERLVEYRALGAEFTKWRAIIEIGEDRPSLTGIEANAHALARFAALSQESGMVPIVEPEVLMDGRHSLARHFEVTRSVLKAVFHSLFEHRVRLEGMLLKPNMVLAGKESPEQVAASTAAEMTRSCMLQCVPAAVPGVVFLSGGQSESEATELLCELNRHGSAPWQLSFSFGRALQPQLCKPGKEPARTPALPRKLCSTVLATTRPLALVNVRKRCGGSDPGPKPRRS